MKLQTIHQETGEGGKWPRTINLLVSVCEKIGSGNKDQDLPLECILGELYSKTQKRDVKLSLFATNKKEYAEIVMMGRTLRRRT